MSNSILFPPVLESIAPVFVGDTLKLYFSIPSYNNINEINHIQATIVNQKTNRSVLTGAPNGICYYPIEWDEDKESYYIRISGLDKVCDLNQYYKVQLRFSQVGIPSDGWTATELYTNQGSFSEWSKVCLIRRISSSKLKMPSLETETKATKITLTNSMLTFVGSVEFDDKTETETVKKFRVIVTNKNTSKVYIDSGDVYTDTYTPNSINYTLKKDLEDGEDYEIAITYETEHGYSQTKKFKVMVLVATIVGEDSDLTVDVEARSDQGCAAVKVYSNTIGTYTGSYTIRRASEKDNYQYWEDVYTCTVSDKTTQKEDATYWRDYTVESGVTYKYAVQERNDKGERGVLSPTPKEAPKVCCFFDDIFLTGKNKQTIRVKYDQQISSFKKVLSETKVDTLGGVYPTIRRNGNIGYNQFPISGIISIEQEATPMYDLLNGRDENHKKYDTAFGLNQEESDLIEGAMTREQDSYVIERDYRKIIMDFLYDGEAKLFKSTTEGNMIVRLMDVSFTPNQTLGRKIYSFSATAYEIADCTLENCDSYSIQSLGAITVKNKTFKEIKLKQIEIAKNSPNRNPYDLINKDLKENYPTDEFDYSLGKITWLSFHFTSAPLHLIYSNDAVDGGWSWKEISNTYVPANIPNNPIVGYVIKLNGKEIIVPEDGRYEIGTDIDIKSLEIFPDCGVVIDYCGEIVAKERLARNIYKYYVFKRVGQMHKIFPSNQPQLSSVRKLQEYDYSNNNGSGEFESVTDINYIQVHAEEGTTLQVYDENDDRYNTFIVGEDEQLTFKRKNSRIKNFKFLGTLLKKKNISESYYNNHDGILGVQVDFENQKTTRLGDAVGRTDGDDFDKFTMFGGRRRCVVNDAGKIVAWYGDPNFVEDGSIGQVMVYQPAFYYRVEPLKIEAIEGGKGYHMWKANYWISEKKISGFKLHPAFIDNGEEIDYLLIGAYKASLYNKETKSYDKTATETDNYLVHMLSSVADAKPRVNITAVSLENRASNRGRGWHNIEYRVRALDVLLILIELGTLNVQKAIGKGAGGFENDNNIYTVNTGGTSFLGNKTGEAKESSVYLNGVVTNYSGSGKVSCSYRGEEDLWGNCWENLTDFLGYRDITNKTCEAYYRTNRPTGSINGTINYSNYTSLNFTIPFDNTSNGWIKAFGYSNAGDWAFIPSIVGGNTLIDDYFSTVAPTSSVTDTSLRVGGSYYGGSGNGILVTTTTTTISSANVATGGRLIYAPSRSYTTDYSENLSNWQKRVLTSNITYPSIPFGQYGQIVWSNFTPTGTDNNPVYTIYQTRSDKAVGATLGVYIDFNTQETERLGDAVGLSGTTDFDKFTMYGGRRRCIVSDEGEIRAWFGDSNYIEDGSLGQVMVYQPKFYYKVEALETAITITAEESTDGIETQDYGRSLEKVNYWISEDEKIGFKVHPAFFNEKGEEVDYILYSAYEGSVYDTSKNEYQVYNENTDVVWTEDLWCSVAGVKPADKRTLGEMENMAKNRGGGWHGERMQSYCANLLLMLIEYANGDIQNCVGSGVIKATTAANTGATGFMGNKSGRTKQGTDFVTIDSTSGTKTTTTETGAYLSSVSYRGQENIWGNSWKRMIGFGVKVVAGQPSYYYICDDYNFVDTGTGEGYYSLISFQAPVEKNYTCKIGYDVSAPWLFLPRETNSSIEATFFRDYTHTKPLDWDAVQDICGLVGGTHNSNLNAGPFCYSLTTSRNYVAGSYYGSLRLFHAPIKSSDFYQSNILKWSEQMKTSSDDSENKYYLKTGKSEYSEITKVKDPLGDTQFIYPTPVEAQVDYCCTILKGEYST